MELVVEVPCSREKDKLNECAHCKRKDARGLSYSVIGPAETPANTHFLSFRIVDRSLLHYRVDRPFDSMGWTFVRMPALSLYEKETLENFLVAQVTKSRGFNSLGYNNNFLPVLGGCFRYGATLVDLQVTPLEPRQWFCSEFCMSALIVSCPRFHEYVAVEDPCKVMVQDLFVLVNSIPDSATVLFTPRLGP